MCTKLYQSDQLDTMTVDVEDPPVLEEDQGALGDVLEVLEGNPEVQGGHPIVHLADQTVRVGVHLPALRDKTLVVHVDSVTAPENALQVPTSDPIALNVDRLVAALGESQQAQVNKTGIKKPLVQLLGIKVALKVPL